MNNGGVGDRVMLTDTNINPTVSHPIVGSEYECMGTVGAVFNQAGLVRVHWVSGRVSLYEHRSLSLYKAKPEDKVEPNYAFLLRKLKKESQRVDL